MSMKNMLASLAIAGSFAAGATGCVVRAQGHINQPVGYVEVEEEPPPPRTVVVETRPGMVWVEGRWYRQGNQWAWRDGYYERERAGQVWEQGRWENRGRGHVWVEGRWRGGGEVNNGPNVRDHRTEHREERREDNGPNVRDHRTH
jgi:hypothetical protein